MKRILSVLLCLLLLAAGFDAAMAEDGKSVDILFLHDLHSHLNAFQTVVDGQTQMVGGFARIQTLVEKQRQQNPDTLLLDAGDFSMGTLIQVTYAEEASELRMLGELGVDAGTLGNHEFDYKAAGLADMLNAAVASGDALPAMVLCNVDWEAMKAAGLTAEQQLLWDAFETYGIRDYIITEKNGVRIAITGVFGIDCLTCAPDCPLLFRNPVEAVKETVALIQQTENPDLIVCVSHGGTWEDESKSEDELLAKAVPELDLIVSGHTHTALNEPIVHGSTYIVSAGEYGKTLGSLRMSQSAEGVWTMDGYELIPVTMDVKPDEAMQARVDALMEQVDQKYLQQFGYTRSQVLCTNEVAFAEQEDTSRLHTEVNLGSIMADGFAYAASTMAGLPVDMAVAPSGVIRDTYPAGALTPEHVFHSFSLGIGRDGIPGYPLICVYLTGEELKIAAEIDASISDWMTAARLYTSGLRWHYNPGRMLLNRVTDVYLHKEGQRQELEDERLYCVIADLYTAKMIGGVTDLSFGLLSVVPKHEDGKPITDYEDAIITLQDGRELKAWAAIAAYMESFEDTDGDGIGNVPLSYAAPEGRKVVETSRNPLELLKNPNRFFWMILGAALVLLALIALIIWLFVKLTILCVRRIRK